MAKYIIIKPDNTTLDISFGVLRGPNNITEFVFDLDDIAIPADVTLVMDNNKGQFSPDVQLFRDFDINQLQVLITDDDDDLIFIGLLKDIKYNLNTANFRVTNVYAKLLSQSVESFNLTATPSEIILELLRLASIPDNLIDLDQLRRLNFVFSTLSGLESKYPSGGVNAAQDTVDWDLLEAVTDVNGDPIFKFISGKNTFKPRATQELTVDIDEVTPIIDILKSVAALSGMQIYTDKGVFTAQLYPNGVDYYDPPLELPQTLTEASSINYDRPLEWRRSEVTLSFDDGGGLQKVSLNASDIAFSDSKFLEDIFAAKPVEFGGLSGKIFHTSLASVENALTTILLLRGPGRFHSSFNMSLATQEGLDILKTLELFKPVQVQFLDHCTVGLPIEMRKLDDKVFIKVLAASERYEYRDSVNTQIDNYELLGFQSLYPSSDSDLSFSGITVDPSIEFLHRNNRANPALLKNGSTLIILNNTDDLIQVDYEFQVGAGSDLLEPRDFVVLATDAIKLDLLIVTFITNCGSLSETYHNVKALDITDADNLLLTNFNMALLTDFSGIISQAP